MAEQFSLPGKPEIWNVDGKAYVVYTIPGSKPPIRLSWRVPSNKDLKSFFGPDQEVTYDRTISRERYRKIGVLNFGNTDELANFDKDPFSTWKDTLRTQAEVQPWILDEDYQALIAMAMLEGRTLTQAEIQTTDWWQNHNEAQREWMKLYHGDPETAQVKLEDNRMMALQMLRDAGMADPSNRLVNYMADVVSRGDRSTVWLSRQIKAVTDPYSNIAIDAGVAEAMRKDDRDDTTADETDTVRDMIREWLGPVHGDWEEAKIERWAGRLRNDPDGEIELEKRLRRQRLALFPDYEDESLTYEDIAQPWRGFASSMWGQTMDETDPLFAKLIKQNDTETNGAMLRRKGLQRGIGKVVTTAREDMLSAAGGQVRRAYQ